MNGYLFKPKKLLMKKQLSILFLLLISVFAFGQGGITLPPSGGNQKASVTQSIGPVTVTINYSSPDVHGPNGADRKGHIWGELVHYGFIDQNFGSSKAAPWRAGANESTTITFSHDVKIGGKDVKAGTYGLFLDVEKDGPWNWIVNKNSTSWGSYFYDEKDDVVRVPSTPTDASYTEWLTYGFEDRQSNNATVYLQWETKKSSFKIEVPNVNDYYVAKIRQELKSSPGFNIDNWVAAAQFSAQNKTNLEEGLTWAESAINGQFGGQKNFTTLSTKAQVLTALGRAADASVVMDEAIKLPDATVQAIHQYGRSLLAGGDSKKALEIFQYNFKTHPDEKFTTFVGLARGYTAVGDTKNAIKNWEIAIKNLPDNQKQNLALYEGEVKKLKETK
jgi:hypothetical protein